MDTRYGDDYGDNQSQSQINSSQVQLSYQEPPSQESIQSQHEKSQSSQESQTQQFIQVLQEVQKSTSNRITLPYLTKYEKALIIGMRAQQISKGGPIYINISKAEIYQLNPIGIAQIEFKEGVVPFAIRRYHPNGQYEDWKLSQLKTFD